MGQTRLQRIQVGLETVPGTGVTAAKLLTGILGQIEDTSAFALVNIDYQTGLLTGNQSGSPVFMNDYAEVQLDGDFTFENAAYLLNMGWQSVAGATAASAASGMVFDFGAPTSAPNTVKTGTIQTGDNYEQLKAVYGFITQFSIKGSANETVKYSGKAQLKAVSAVTTGFDAATAIAGTPMQSNLFKLYADPASGTAGTTQVTGTLREFSLNVDTGLHPKQFLDGSASYTNHGQDRPKVTLDVVLELNANSSAIRSDWKNRNQKTPAPLDQQRRDDQPQSFYKDLSGYWSKMQKIGDKDGNTIVAATFTCAPAGTTTNDFLNFKVVNSLTGGL
jgi:hypothetical protein